MKNISFLQMVLGISGGLLIYSGIKNIEINKFLTAIIKDPATAFTQGFKYTNPGPGATGTPSSTPTTPNPNPERPV